VPDALSLTIVVHTCTLFGVILAYLGAALLHALIRRERVFVSMAPYRPDCSATEVLAGA
jgi:cytochrome b561